MLFLVAVCGCDNQFGGTSTSGNGTSSGGTCKSPELRRALVSFQIAAEKANRKAMIAAYREVELQLRMYPELGKIEG